MALSRAQHSRIMSEYQNRRFYHIEEQSRRAEEISLHIPAFDALIREQTALRLRQAEALMKKEQEAAGAAAARIAELDREKKALLKAHGYPEDYLSLCVSCPYCKDTGFVGNERCACQKKLISELMLEGAALSPYQKRENFENFDLTVFDNEADVPELHSLFRRRMTQREYMQRVAADCRRYVREFSENGGNLLFMGHSGTGKTFLSNCIAQELIAQCYQVCYVSAAEYFERANRSHFSFEKNEAEEAELREIERCDLLILDDLGTELSSAYVGTKLFSLLNERLNREKPMIISTNLSLNDLMDVYGERISSRMIKAFTIVPFYGKDLRLTGGRA